MNWTAIFSYSRWIHQDCPLQTHGQVCADYWYLRSVQNEPISQRLRVSFYSINHLSHSLHIRSAKKFGNYLLIMLSIGISHTQRGVWQSRRHGFVFSFPFFPEFADMMDENQSTAQLILFYHFPRCWKPSRSGCGRRTWFHAIHGLVFCFRNQWFQDIAIDRRCPFFRGARRLWYSR